MPPSVHDTNARVISFNEVALKFSPEDIQVLRECNKESFYQRSLPLSGVLGIATYSAIKSGFLKPNLRMGVVPKVGGAFLLGYILGKLSYRKVCSQRLMDLPNSEVGNTLRKRANLPPNSFAGTDFDKPIMLSQPENENDKDTQSTNSSLHLDMDRPSMSLEDSFQSPSDGGYKPLSDIMANTPSLTYDDMRKLNRNEHSIRRSQPYITEDTAKPAKLQTDQERKNQYGDVIN